MDKEILESYKKAGKIAAYVRDGCKNIMKPGTKLVEIADWVEGEILRRGAEIAFPVNISINHVAAHYTPDWNDETELKEGDMVKIDVGVHVNGYIGDTARTYYIGTPTEEEKKMMEINKTVLKKAIEILRPGLKISEIGNLVGKIAEESGFKIIKNLTGHGLERFDLHSEPQILNFPNNSSYTLSEGQAIAIEPFVTNGSGLVNDTDQELIFSVFHPVATRNMDARKITQFGKERLGLPFAKRWIINGLKMSDVRFRLALRELKMRNGIYTYPVLSEVEGSKVSQFEHTILIFDKPIVTTLGKE
ncbi:MAG: type II methionyl aminopeptidase [Candidatus Aenigmarchaeota archaeon]|nr:type II methionyl aminopeptidase [Candidatus Aenigmarchaeota archaeon]